MPNADIACALLKTPKHHMSTLRVALIGCGKIADQHILAINRSAVSKVIAACDREPLMAKQLAERFAIDSTYSDAAEMLAKARPDVVHISTPPEGHFPLAKLCLEAGAHVYLEKPFTVTAPEAESIIALARSVNRKITAGHNLQFTLEMLQMRELVRNGYLGGKPVHLESHFSYSLDDTSYVGPLLGNRNHWVRRLPGQLFHNIISHGIAKLSEFLEGNVTRISAYAHQSKQLQKLGGGEVMDELRVMLEDSGGTTAYFCFTTQVRPGVNQLRIYGPKATLQVDHATGSIVRHTNRAAKSYLTYILPPIRQARELARNSAQNAIRILRQDLHQDSGMKELIEQFHLCIRNDTPPPIPYAEILTTARIMDEIFRQIGKPNQATGV